jgi:hypothetical protein
VLLEPTPRVRGVGRLKAPDAGDWTHARQRPAPPTPKSCSDQPKALWLAICANRIRVSLTYIVARARGTLSRARHVSIGVRLIFCEVGVAISFSCWLASLIFDGLPCRSLATFATSSYVCCTLRPVSPSVNFARRERLELAGLRPSSSAIADQHDRNYTSVCSAISRTSSTSIPRYLTVLSSLVWPRRS